MELGQLLGWDAYFYSIFAQAINMEEFTVVALRALRELRFDFFAYGMCSATPFMRPKTYMYGNYPQHWIQRYQSANYAKIDPTVKHSKVSSAPILWSNELFRDCPGLWSEANDSNLCHGLAQPSFNTQGRVGVLSLARKDNAISLQEFEALKPVTKAFAAAALEKISALEGDIRVFNTDVEFSERECDVLRWTADGKTSEEIGVIMGVCADTVNYHHRNIQRKIGASNRVQAVSYAVALGYI
ncbi:autoinducer binding domain-containing protein [Pseudomonas fluorescens]|uniref:Autoinducer binding domain-containing protein n=1 Tax=Pseudomonas fluorescens TaxID=294 RepID=A0AAE2U3C6_PSEFL|nr:MULTISPECIES: autoinducer binding domain-containing protein [Pseudomonas fluorescens group]MBA1429826.1 transcriptional regulator [Pseudomonas orientalis]MBD8148161.1 autoinducer binding domain-containing protein [Pseudomonas fluorescens]MBD8178232.1 autoinducer binding domain-containing protein [Pseudomonas fluorescens]MBD8269003.1 autoinducer binding domain-containing protein [Pseudomonas fluorescens]MBD8747507.1 autoinducer binding domain-containing protein [Pseudomonas fluorescens]